MRKVSICLISVALCLCLFMFVGCDPNASKNNDINIEDCEVGYKVDVYPDFPFDYQVQRNETSFIVHIESIDVTLTEINTIQEDEVVSGRFYPYGFTISVKATTISSLAGIEIFIRLLKNDLLDMITTTVQENGEINWTTIWYVMDIPHISFSDIIILTDITII